MKRYNAQAVVEETNQENGAPTEEKLPTGEISELTIPRKRFVGNILTSFVLFSIGGGVVWAVTSGDSKNDKKTTDTKKGASTPIPQLDPPCDTLIFTSPSTNKGDIGSCLEQKYANEQAMELVKNLQKGMDSKAITLSDQSKTGIGSDTFKTTNEITYIGYDELNEDEIKLEALGKSFALNDFTTVDMGNIGYAVRFFKEGLAFVMRERALYLVHKSGAILFLKVAASSPKNSKERSEAVQLERLMAVEAYRLYAKQRGKNLSTDELDLIFLYFEDKEVRGYSQPAIGKDLGAWGMQKEQRNNKPVEVGEFMVKGIEHNLQIGENIGQVSIDWNANNILVDKDGNYCVIDMSRNMPIELMNSHYFSVLVEASLKNTVLVAQKHGLDKAYIQKLLNSYKNALRNSAYLNDNFNAHVTSAITVVDKIIKSVN